MVSRRKILSRSRDDLNLDQTFSPKEEEEDVWYQKDKLYKEHIQEVLDKWTQIDDEIWAKVIVFERNRRVAKAYARAPVLTINGSDDGFDGMRIGLCGFDNPMRDQKTDEFKRHIGQGVKIKMDDAGNILIRRYAKSNVYIKSTASNSSEETSIGADILKLPNQALESEKIVKLFDMKKFQSNVNRELRRAYPDRRRLETQCLSAVAFVKSENDILECPIWVLIVNVVAMDMLKSKLPPVQRPMVDIKNRPRIPIPDEDPYSVAGNGSGGSSGSSGFGANNGHQQSAAAVAAAMTNGNGVAANMHLNNGNNMNGNNSNTGHVAATREQLLLQTQQLAHKRSEKPPKLPPRDNIYAHDIIPKPDYDDIDVETRIKLSRGKSDKGKDNKKYDDPYYCGLRARVPNFVKTSKSSKDHAINGHSGSNGHNGSSNNSSNSIIGTLSQKKTSVIQHMPLAAQMHPAQMHPAMHAPPPPHMHPHHIQQQQMMAVAAAHAGHHPAAAAAAAAAAAHHHQHQMWQTRSFESGIGIYSQHHLSATSATNFILEHNQAAPPTLPTTTALLTATTTPAAAAAALGNSGTTMNTTTATDKTATTNLVLPMATTTTTTGSTDIISTATGLGRPNKLSKHTTRHGQHLQQEHPHSHHHHHHHHHRQHHGHNCAHRSVDYYHPQRQQQHKQHLPLLDKYALESADYHQLEQRQQLSRRSSSALAPHVSPQRSTRSTSGVADSNCNCMSCYTLAPLFGAVPPPRPPRSLSQQQLRQHQRLGGLIDTPPPPLPPPSSNVVRWCSESDVSLVERERAFGDYDDDNDDGFASFSGGRLKAYSNSERNERRNDFDNCDDYNFDYDPDMDLDEIESSMYDALQPPTLMFGGRQQNPPPTSIYGGLRRGIAPSLSQKRKPNAIYINNNNKSHVMLANRETQTQTPPHQFELHQRNTASMEVDDTATFLTDSYVDTRAASRLRQQPQRIKGTALWATRQKSLSTESFFEQPNEEGTLYLYGGRRRIPKAPSTTNIYDRVRSSLEAASFQQHLANQRRRFSSQLNSNAATPSLSNLNFNAGKRQWSNRAAVRREQNGVLRDVNDNNNNSSNNNRVVQPKLPAPCWQRGGKRNDFFVTPLAAATKRQYNNNNNDNSMNNLNRLDMKNRHNNNKTNNMSAKQSNCDKQQQKLQQQQQQLNNEAQQKTDLNKNLKQQQQLRHKTTNNNKINVTSNISNVGSNIASNSKNKTINNNSQDNNNNHSNKQTQEQQLEQQQQQQQQRTSRPSRIDISDMESIYGYLKPRKPRSLSLKKIQILDY